MTMKCLRWIARWAMIAFAIGILGLFVAHLLLRASADRADSEQYAVYSAYIDPGLTGYSHDLGSRNGVVVIHAKTVISDQLVNKSLFNQYRSILVTIGHAQAEIPQLRRALLFEFLVANLREKQLERRFQLPARYVLATDEEIDSGQYMTRFTGSYGYLTFSPVAFNSDLTEAFFYTEHVCGLCGEGKYVFMRKIRRKWVVEGTAYLWVS